MFINKNNKNTSTRKTLKILMVMTANLNLGDSVLSENDYYLIQKALGGRKAHIFKYGISTRDISQVRYVDAVIFAGGILKTFNEKFWLYIPEIIEEANSCNVPVFMSAIGAEPIDPEDPRSARLIAALNLPCLKGISVRDDIDTLRSVYISNPNIRISKVLDPAIWCPETYRGELAKGPFPKEFAGLKDDRKLIGIGVTRETLFGDYGHPEISDDMQTRYWLDVIEGLEEKNFNWVLFTNGDRLDEIAADRILQKAGHGRKLPAPMDASVMVRYISGFDGVIAGRMHSNIVAYSFGIPSIGFVWNRKLRFWSENIGHPERFLDIDELNGKEAVDRLCSALNEKAAPTPEMLGGVYQELQYFLKNHCRIREGRNEDLDFGRFIAATSLGGIENRFKNTNSLEAIHYSAERGSRIFQTDVRLTSDNIAVCVNGWNAETYRNLGLHDEIDESKDGQKALTWERFRTLLYRNRMHTMSFDNFICEAASLHDRDTLKFVLSIGRPSEAQFDSLIRQILESIDAYDLARSHFLLRLERKEDVAAFREKDTGIEIMFYQIDSLKNKKAYSKAVEEALAYCSEDGIPWLCVNDFDETMGDLFDEYPEIKGACFRYTSVGKVVKAIRCGAKIVGSHYYGVDYIKALTGRE